VDDGPAGPVVLLVDDHDAIRRTVAAGLELEGFSVVPASGGRAQQNGHSFANVLQS